MAGASGIEIPVTLNPNGTVQGLGAIDRALQDVTRAANDAGGALDKVGGGGGQKAGPGGGAVPAPGGAPQQASFWDSRVGQFSQRAMSAGLTFTERMLPDLFDPTKSNIEKAMAAGPLAARHTAQMAAAGGVAALDAAMKTETGGMAGLPEEIKQQIIQAAGVAAEEAAKSAFRELGAMLQSAKGGAMQTLLPFAQVGVLPDQGTMQEILNSYAQVGKREFALQKSIAEAINNMGMGMIDDQRQKQISSMRAGDSGGIVDVNAGAGSLRGPAGG